MTISATAIPEVINRIWRITGTAPDVVKGDVRDVEALISALSAHGCSAVIHLAGLKSVADSVSNSASITIATWSAR